MSLSVTKLTEQRNKMSTISVRSTGQSRTKIRSTNWDTSGIATAKAIACQSTVSVLKARSNIAVT